MKFRRIVLAASFVLAACSQPPAAITSFEECLLAGYPIMETYPRRCAVPNGPTFTEAPVPVAPAP